MMDFGKWALKNKKLLYFLIFVLVVGGFFAFYNMSKLEDPEITVRKAMIVTTYPGASAHQVELEVTDVLEKTIRSMGNTSSVISKSMNDLSLIEVTLSTLVKESNLQQYWDLLRRKVSDAESSLPTGASKPQVLDNFGDVYGMFYAMTNDGYSHSDANKYAEYVKQQVLNIEGISDVQIYGKINECINITIAEDKIASLGIHPAEVLATLNGQNMTIYAGYYQSGDNRIRMTVNDKYTNTTDIANLLIQGHEKDQIRLRDIAELTVGEDSPVRNKMFYDGTPALGISISAESGTDITKLGREVEKTISKLEREILPAGIELHKVFFQPERVNSSLWTFMLNLIESVLIVVVLLMLTMGFRSGVIIGKVLVIIVFASFVVLNVFHGTLQRVSLGAFIVAMGMLVDNAIVIVDGILVDMKQCKDKKEALTAIGRKTAMPLLGATLIAILAFLPIFLSPDVAGTYVRDLFIVLAVSLLFSWILAVTYVPVTAEKRLKVKQSEDNPFDSKYYKKLRNVLSWVLCHKTFTIGSSLVLVVASIICFKYVPREFFPDMEYDQLYIEYKLPEGFDGDAVKKDLDSISKYLNGRDEVTHITESLGGTPSRYNLVRSIATPSLSYGELIVDFESPKKLVRNLTEIQDYLTAHYPQAYVRVKRYNLMYMQYPIEVRFNGPDPEVLKDLTAKAEDIMRKSSKTQLVCNNWEPQVPVLTVDYNQPVARQIGLSRSDVSLSLLAAAGGIPTGSFYEGIDSRTIYLKSVDANGNQIESINNTPVFGMVPPIKNIDKKSIVGLITGSISEQDFLEEMFRTVPLSQVASGIKIEWEDPVVVRYNGERSMSAQCNPVPGISNATAREDILDQIESIPLPTGYSLDWAGEYKASKDSTAYLFKNFPLAIIIMIVILLLLFGDYKKPLVLICCLPMLFVGVVFGMLASGKAFGFVAIVGVLGLIGMLLKNGIVLMDEIMLQLDSGKDPMEALLDSSSNRFRPVMMASLTTILGMVPLLGDSLFGSLAVTIMSGLLVGTLITLLFLPVLYAVFFNIKTEKKK